MMCALIVRRLKPGTYEQFRAAWQPEEWWPGLQRVWLCRHDDDADVVATWALLDLDDEQAERMREDPEWLAGEARRLQQVAEVEEELIISGFFQIAEEVAPG